LFYDAIKGWGELELWPRRQPDSSQMDWLADKVAGLTGDFFDTNM